MPPLQTWPGTPLRQIHWPHEAPARIQIQMVRQGLLEGTSDEEAQASQNPAQKGRDLVVTMHSEAQVRVLLTNLSFSRLNKNLKT